LESGLLREEGDRYVLDGPLPPLALPATLHASLMARLDRLASVRLVAQSGAAIGREFVLLHRRGPHPEHVSKGLISYANSGFGGVPIGADRDPTVMLESSGC
jgi:hypothetical protein